MNRSEDNTQKNLCISIYTDINTSDAKLVIDSDENVYNYKITDTNTSVTFDELVDFIKIANKFNIKTKLVINNEGVN